ncbi:hypothetical protein BDQ12DRAFT_111619 [Crucibulum laeve]|uniref:Uncharacterized protein n=1 Tax=Crucibulum laeve TaxID=68775 RepID=A0A5C3LZP9_9AGAR|nr:hypothetical protein BDQ12DRAFT_111619 [Crucibulum laeve]
MNSLPPMMKPQHGQSSRSAPRRRSLPIASAQSRRAFFQVAWTLTPHCLLSTPGRLSFFWCPIECEPWADAGPWVSLGQWARSDFGGDGETLCEGAATAAGNSGDIAGWVFPLGGWAARTMRLCGVAHLRMRFLMPSCCSVQPSESHSWLFLPVEIMSVKPRSDAY